MGEKQDALVQRRTFLKVVSSVFIPFPIIAQGKNDLDIPHQYHSGLLHAFEVAEGNAVELKKALEAVKDDAEKLEAMCFLIQETPNRMFQRFSKDSWREQPSEDIDAKTVKSSYLIKNVDLAFKAREQLPWTKDLCTTQQDFFSYVLPYRIGTGPLDQFGDPSLHWRAFLWEPSTYQQIKDKFKLKTTFEELWEKISGFADHYKKAKKHEEKVSVIKDLIAFLDIDFYHKNEGICYFPRGSQEQGFSEFFTPRRTTGGELKGGRCTDLDNRLRMDLMSLGIPTTATRIIAWPKGDGNHELLSWNILGSSFDLTACVSPERHQKYLQPEKFDATKVYAEQWGNWSQASILPHTLKKEKFPFAIGFYLGTRSMIDVTSRYTQTVSISLKGAVPSNPIYLGVWNNESDLDSLGIVGVAVEMTNEKGQAFFQDVGCNDILYLAYQMKNPSDISTFSKVGTLFIAHKNGQLESLLEEKSTEKGKEVVLSKKLELEQGKEYELMTFKGGGWEFKGKVNSANPTRPLQPNVPYILKNNSEKFTRPFVYRYSGDLEKY